MFQGCTSLKSVKFPKDLKEIRFGAFSDCPIENNGFLKDGTTPCLYIPDGVTSIASKAFNMDTKAIDPLYTAVSINQSTAFETDSFYLADDKIEKRGDSSLTDEWTYSKLADDSLKILSYTPKSAWASNLIIPEKINGDLVSEISNNFATASNIKDSLKNLTFEARAQKLKLGDKAFEQCEELETVSFLGGEYNFGDSVFVESQKLTTVSMDQSSITKVGKYAFDNCKNLTSVTLPNTLTSIGEGAFKQCLNLANIQLPENLTTIEQYAFNICKTLTSMEFPANCTEIGDYAFQSCESLTNVIFPVNSKLDNIGEGAFYNCKLTNNGHFQTDGRPCLYLPDKVTSIGEDAFVDDSGGLEQLYTAVSVKNGTSFDKTEMGRSFKDISASFVEQRQYNTPAGMSITGETTVKAGEKLNLTVSMVDIDNNPVTASEVYKKWTSDNNSIATVNPTTGEVTGQAGGITNITVTSNNISESIAITVTGNPPSKPDSKKDSKPDSKPEIKPEIKPDTTPSEPEKINFTDISNHWGQEAIMYVVEKGYFRGITQDSFGPEAKMTRGMMAVVLFNMSNDRNIDANSAKYFTDVEVGQWYEQAVMWMTSKQISNGYPDGSFQPNKPMTRQEAALLIQKLMEMQGITLSKTDKLAFNDQSNIALWAKDAVAFVQETGIMSGRSDGRFDPTATLTRAEMAAILMNLDKQINK